MSFLDWNHCRRGALLLLCLLAVGLTAGCVGDDLGDLKQYVNKVKARKSKKIAPLPPIKIPEVYTYASVAAVDPFQPFIVEPPEVDKDPEMSKKFAEQVQREVREELEYFPLDALRMVGTLEQGQDSWGLITAPDGVVHRIQVGNYMGKNYGKVTIVSEDHIELLEIVPDNIGGWQERPARLDLAE